MAVEKKVSTSIAKANKKVPTKVISKKAPAQIKPLDKSEANLKIVKTVPKNKTIKKEKLGLFGKVSKFFSETIKEVSKVKWPNRKDMVKYSVATIVFVLFFAIFFYLIDIIVALVKTWV